MTFEEIQTAANEWVGCVKNGRIANGIRNACPEADETDAYRVQKKAEGILRSRGVSVLGKKIAFTDQKQRKKRGFPDAVYGFISGENIYQNGAKLQLWGFPKKLEPELAFIIGEDIHEARDIGDIIGKISAVMPSFEIVESRLPSADSRYENVIANNAGFYGAVLGEKHMVLPDIDFSAIHMKLYKDEEPLGEAEGGVIMGNPLNALVWLAGKAFQNGEFLKKGDIILSGSFLPAVSLETGHRYKACFDVAGEICLFT